MSDSVVHDSAKLVNQLRATSAEFSQWAAAVNDRILAAEAWFNSLPGRVPVSIYVSDPSVPGDKVMKLAIARSGQTWSLYFNHSSPDEDDDEIPLIPISQASVGTKICALRAIPELLTAMLRTQQAYVAQLQAAVRAFDEFTTQPSGGGVSNPQLAQSAPQRPPVAPRPVPTVPPRPFPVRPVKKEGA